MKPIGVKSLSLARFNALIGAGATRSPAASFIGEELGWYSNEDESILGIVIHDLIDDDFAAVLLAKDEGGRFRWFDGTASVESEYEATEWLRGAIRWHTGMGVKVVAQGDKTTGPDLFSVVAPIEKLHPDFVALARDDAFLPAREMINRMMPHYVDIDGNFVQQFQTTGFDSRLWELYLYAYLTEEELFLDRSYSAPDFLVTKFGKSVAIEAVIVGRSSENPPKVFKTAPSFKSPAEIREAHEGAIPIKFGSPLYSKLTKEYWNLPHVQGNPLIFAIADFHDDQSMLWTSSALTSYLYGVRHDFHYDENGQLVISPIKIETHTFGDKTIPSGYFFVPGAENVSAVLFSASGTVSKFNRIGRQAGFCHPDVRMIRFGTCHDHNPNAALPRSFKYEVDEKCHETWAEGLSIFHNPSATHPIPAELFPRAAHHYFKDGQIVSHLPEFFPYASWTLNLRIKR